MELWRRNKVCWDQSSDGAITCSSSELIIDNMSFNVVYVDESIPNVEVIADEFFN